MRMYMNSLGTGVVNAKPKLSETDINIIFDGNSITLGQGSGVDQNFPKKVKLWLIGKAKTIEFYSFGVGGLKLRQMIARAPTLIDVLIDPEKTNVIVAFEDANGILLGDVNGQENYDDMIAYEADRRAAGFDYVIILSGYNERRPFPASVLPNFPAQQDYFDLIKANPLGDVTCDLRLAKNIGGPYGQERNSYFYDYIHLTESGYYELADYVEKKGMLGVFQL